MHPPALVTDVEVGHAPWNLPRQQAVADDADGGFLDGMLRRMMENEENISDFQSLSNMSQLVLSGNERGPPNYVWDPDDFFEEKDLDSESTCVPSMTWDGDYFDPEALLRELAPCTQVQASVSASRGSHQQHKCSLGGSSSNKKKNPLMMKIVVSVSIDIGRSNHTHHPPAASVEESPYVGASKELGLPLQRRPKRGRSSLEFEGRSSKVSRRFA